MAQLDSTKLDTTRCLSTAALADVPAAGAGAPAAAHETARAALEWGPRPATPPAIKEGGYQHYARQPPGVAVRHFSTARDPPREGPFGCKTRRGAESAADCFRAVPDSEVARWMQERAEDVYASRKREPLGVIPSRSYQLPNGLDKTEAFGVPLHVREQERLNSIKSVIFPQAPAEDAAAAPMYARTHGSFAPGEQRRRGYDWSSAGYGAGIDPTTHRFGLSGAGAARRHSAQQLATVREILQPGLDGGVEPPPAVVSHLVCDHQLSRGDALGRRRLLGTSDTPAPPGGVYGAPSAREPEPTVGELIRCSYPLEDQQPDADLGKSPHQGCRATGLVAGAAPPAGARRGAGGGALQALFPPPWAELGLDDAQLAAPRSRDEIASLAAAAGVAFFDESQFDEVFVAAEEERLDSHGGIGSGGRTASLAAFMRARQAWLRAQCAV